MLCLGLVAQTRCEHISQTSIEAVYNYRDGPQTMGNIQKTHDTKW